MKVFDCDLYMDLMPLVKDGAASESSREALEAHLRTCEGCREIFDTLPETPAQADDGKALETLSRIRRHWQIATLVVVILGTLVGVSITSFRGMTVLNLILMPLVGIAAYIALRGKGWLVPVGVLAVSVLGMMVRYTLIDGDALADVWANTTIMALYYCFLCAFGVMVANLCGYVFAHLEGEDPLKLQLERLKRIGLALWYLVLVVGFTGFFQVFFGNPIAKASAEGDAAYYAEANYRGHDFTVGEAEYNMKRGGYFVWVYSTSSVDTYFEIGYNSLGIRTWDSYDDYVGTGMTTYWRLWDSYNTAVADTLVGSPFEFVDYQTKPFGYPPEDWLDELEFDREYSQEELNLWAVETGTIGVAYDPAVNGEKTAAELLLEIRRLMDEAGIAFCSVELKVAYSTGNHHYTVPYEVIREDTISDELHKYKLG